MQLFKKKSDDKKKTHKKGKNLFKTPKSKKGGLFSKNKQTDYIKNIHLSPVVEDAFFDMLHQALQNNDEKYVYDDVRRIDDTDEGHVYLLALNNKLIGESGLKDHLGDLKVATDLSSRGDGNVAGSIFNATFANDIDNKVPYEKKQISFLPTNYTLGTLSSLQDQEQEYKYQIVAIPDSLNNDTFETEYNNGRVGAPLKNDDGTPMEKTLDEFKKFIEDLSQPSMPLDNMNSAQPENEATASDDSENEQLTDAPLADNDLTDAPLVENDQNVVDDLPTDDGLPDDDDNSLNDIDDDDFNLLDNNTNSGSQTDTEKDQIDPNDLSDDDTAENQDLPNLVNETENDGMSLDDSDNDLPNLNDSMSLDNTSDDLTIGNSDDLTIDNANNDNLGDLNSTDNSDNDNLGDLNSTDDFDTNNLDDLNSTDDSDNDNLGDLNSTDDFDNDNLGDLNNTDNSDADNLGDLNSTNDFDTDNLGDLNNTDDSDNDNLGDLNSTDDFDTDNLGDLNSTDNSDTDNLGNLNSTNDSDIDNLGDLNSTDNSDDNISNSNSATIITKDVNPNSSNEDISTDDNINNLMTSLNDNNEGTVESDNSEPDINNESMQNTADELADESQGAVSDVQYNEDSPALELDGDDVKEISNTDLTNNQQANDDEEVTYVDADKDSAKQLEEHPKKDDVNQKALKQIQKKYEPKIDKALKAIKVVAFRIDPNDSDEIKQHKQIANDALKTEVYHIREQLKEEFNDQIADKIKNLIDPEKFDQNYPLTAKILRGKFLDKADIDREIDKAITEINNEYDALRTQKINDAIKQAQQDYEENYEPKRAQLVDEKDKKIKKAHQDKYEHAINVMLAYQRGQKENDIEKHVGYLLDKQQSSIVNANKEVRKDLQNYADQITQAIQLNHLIDARLQNAGVNNNLSNNAQNEPVTTSNDNQVNSLKKQLNQLRAENEAYKKAQEKQKQVQKLKEELNEQKRIHDQMIKQTEDNNVKPIVPESVESNDEDYDTLPDENDFDPTSISSENTVKEKLNDLINSKDEDIDL